QRRRAAVLAALADELLVPEEVHLVAWRYLPGETQTEVVILAIDDRLVAQVWLVGPDVRKAFVLVVEHVEQLCRALSSRRSEEPESILADRPTDGGADVVVRDEGGWRHCSGRLQFIGEIGPLQCLRTPSGIETAGHAIASGTRHHV